MFIKRLRVENFKSFRKLDIELGPLNVLVGANASGKSNLVNVLAFLKNIINNGLDNAISQEGGARFLTNNQLSNNQPLQIQIVYEAKKTITSEPLQKNNLQMELKEVNYQFSLQLDSSGTYQILYDKLQVSYDFSHFNNESNTVRNLGGGFIDVISDPLSKEIFIDPKQIPVEAIEFKNNFLVFLNQNSINNSESELLIRHSVFSVMANFNFNASSSLQNIPIYDFDPQELKKPQPLAGRLTLEENGSNLPLVLRNLLAHPEQKRTFNNLVSYLLPHIKDLQVQAMGNSLYFETEEIYSSRALFPSSFLSPGTVNVIALIVALYFQGKSTMVFEEPERNIHPGLISKLMELFKEVAQNKQIILTTHNPQLVKHTDLDSLYLVSRDKEGFSIVTKPGERLEVQTFLENDLGIDDLYVQNLLEGWA